MLLDDGRMVFMDFGLYKRIPDRVADFELNVQRLGTEGRADELLEELHTGGFLQDASRHTPGSILAQFREITWWYTVDQEVQLEPEIATRVMIELSDPRSSFFAQMRHETLPPDHLFGRRLEMLTLAVLSQLRARGNWHRVAREWMYGDPPVTELGEQEAEYLAGRRTTA